MLSFRSLLIAALALVAVAANAADTSDAPPSAELDAETQALKGEILDLQAELLALERDIRYPAPDRWTVFVTAEPVEDFTLESLALEVDGNTVATHRYTTKERSALADGGAHRLHLGTLGLGRHRITATLAGRHEGEAFERKQTFTVDKPDGPRVMELRLHPRVAAKDAAAPGFVSRHLDDLP